MNNNIFTTFLKLLRVKHTKQFSNQYFNEHPYKYNLFGLSQMLLDYGISNKGIRFEDKNQIQQIETPFIAHTGNELVIVSQIDSKGVLYFWHQEKIRVSIDEFKQSWSGIVLLAEVNENSQEPEYRRHHRKELIGYCQKFLLLLAVSTISSLFFISNQLYTNARIILSLFINIVGFYLGYMLILKQLHIQSNYTDKICSLFKQTNCNNILESDAAKLFGAISWSEIGLGYFTSNIIILLFFPELILYLALINICTLPYTIWSIWYQKVKAKQWCTLCLLTQILLWSLFITNLQFNFLELSNINLPNTLLAGSIYIIPLLIINISIPFLTKAKQVEQITWAMNNFRTNEDIFLTLLKKQAYYKTEDSDSNIIFGSANSKLKITVLTNPHCEPCALMHERIEKLLMNTNNNIYIQYIFSSFDKNLDSSNKFLITVYKQNSIKKTMAIYSEWFKKGKYKIDEFFRKYDFIENIECEDEFQRHRRWKDKHRFRTTPIILVNGFKLPENYKIEDLRFFIGININKPHM